MEPARYRIEFTQQKLLPLAAGFGVVGALFIHELWARIAFGVSALVVVGVTLLVRRARPQLVLDDSGYAVEELGREKLRVAWSEVVKVRADEAEHALYVDVGDPKRNLLVPPSSGYGFRFERAPELYARILQSVPAEKVERVEPLDATVPKA